MDEVERKTFELFTQLKSAMLDKSQHRRSIKRNLLSAALFPLAVYDEEALPLFFPSRCCATSLWDNYFTTEAMLRCKNGKRFSRKKWLKDRIDLSNDITSTSWFMDICARKKIARKLTSLPVALLRQNRFTNTSQNRAQLEAHFNRHIIDSFEFARRRKFSNNVAFDREHTRWLFMLTAEEIKTFGEQTQQIGLKAEIDSLQI